MISSAASSKARSRPAHRTVNIPDTVGYAVPEEYAALIRMLFNRVPNIDKAVISVHCHNDLGLAVANSLAAVLAGARQIECTVNGLGERAGNAAMEEIVMALRTRQDSMPYTTGIKSEYITRASRLVSAVTGFVVQPNKAIVGANAFAHESGIHQDGMLKHAGTYEIMTPELVGLGKSTLVMGKHSGRHAFKMKLKELGFELGDNALNDAFRRFKEVADRKKDVFDEDIVALVDDEMQREQERIKFVSLQVIAGSKGPQSAEIELEFDGMRKTAKTEGNGPVDATFNAIRAIVPQHGPADALPGACGHRRHRRPGRGHSAARRGRQDRGRPGRRSRHAGRFGPRLYPCSEQVADQAGQDRARGAHGMRKAVQTPNLGSNHQNVR